nr:hypothetical protein [Solidesulfovibrio alcoholivorans]
MAIAEDIARGREFGLFCPAETTPGQLVFPASTDAVLAAGFPDMNQNPSYTDSEEIQTDTRGLIDQFQDMTPAGSVPIKIYARPSGTKGSVPMGDAILASMFGKRTVNAGASVVYSPAVLKPAFSTWYRRGPVVFFGRGCVVDQGKISAVNKGAVGVETNIQFMEMGWAGLDDLTADAAAAATAITVTNAKKFRKGARIYNKTQNDFATNGYEVTDVNSDGGGDVIHGLLRLHEIARRRLIEPHGLDGGASFDQGPGDPVPAVHDEALGVEDDGAVHVGGHDPLHVRGKINGRLDRVPNVLADEKRRKREVARLKRLGPVDQNGDKPHPVPATKFVLEAVVGLEGDWFVGGHSQPLTSSTLALDFKNGRNNASTARNRVPAGAPLAYCVVMTSTRSMTTWPPRSRSGSISVPVR